MSNFSEQELLTRFGFYTLQIESRLQDEDFHTIGEELPFAFSVNDPKIFQICYVNKKHEQHMGYTLQEMEERWDEYVRLIHPVTVQEMHKFLPAFYTTQKSSQTTAFFQFVKAYGEKDHSAVITFTKPSSLPSGHILWLSLKPRDFGKLARKVERIVEMDQFKLKHFRQFQELTEREIDVLTLLAEGRNNPEIADCLFISRQTVETHRKKIKTKLGLNSYNDLMKYAIAFNLVQL